MFDFTKEVIINSQFLADEFELDVPRYEGVAPGGTIAGSTGGVTYDDGLFRVLRCADYITTYVVGQEVTKTAGVRGVNAVAEIDLTGLTLQPGTYRLSVYLRMPNKYLADWAQAAWKEFTRPLVVEVTATASDTATTLAEKFMKAINLSIPENYPYLIATDAAGVITITARSPYIVIDETRVDFYEPNATLPSEGEYVDQGIATNVTTPNVEPFATGAWVQENLRFPTYPNLRYESPNGEEYPVAGELYTQYTFQYEVPREGLHGISAVGQKIESVTTHVFYVASGLITTFEAALTTAGLNIV